MAFTLSLIAGTTDYSASKGASVTIVIKNHIGSFLFAKAEYAGVQLVPAGAGVSSLTFTVAADRNSLKMVFANTAGTAGRGELREEAGGDSQFLRDLAGHEPFQLIRIFGT